MIPLKVTPGRIGIIVWRRRAWQSMPHVVGENLGTGVAMTRCGYKVELFTKGVDGIVMTSIPGGLFWNAGCGRCAQYLLRDMRAELRAADPEARAKIQNLLAKMEWIEHL